MKYPMVMSCLTLVKGQGHIKHCHSEITHMCLINVLTTTSKPYMYMKNLRVKSNLTFVQGHVMSNTVSFKSHIAAYLV